MAASHSGQLCDNSLLSDNRVLSSGEMASRETSGEMTVSPTLASAACSHPQCCLPNDEDPVTILCFKKLGLAEGYRWPLWASQRPPGSHQEHQCDCS